ncbi:MAG: RasGEF domain-containing protein, partial [archaeon]|nr:RasGEF domain-containing protein [archaeon]
QFKTLMSPTSNSAAYRNYLRALNPPCVPYIGSVLTDLTFTDDATRDYRDEECLVINFGKCFQTSNLINSLLSLQLPAYNLQTLPFIQQLLSTKWLDHSRLYNTEVLLALSRVLEPR